MAFVHAAQDVKDPEIGKLIVPIVPDRPHLRHGSLFRTVEFIRASAKVRARGREHAALLQRKRRRQILSEALRSRSMASFMSPPDRHATHGINMIPFSSITRCSRVPAHGDFISAAADMRTRGFRWAAPQTAALR
jgi:pyruvate dehydrogenase E1 component